MAKAGASAAQEPSMEEILASIRRIIAEEEPAPEPSAPAAGLQRAQGDVSGREVPRPMVSPAEVDALFGARAEAVAEAASGRRLPEPPTVSQPRAAEPRISEPRAAERPVAERPLHEQPLRSTIAPSTPRPAAPAPRIQEPVAVEPPRAAVTPPAAVEPRRPSLLSPTTDAAVQTAFGALAGSMIAGSQKTLDDLVTEMLRPMLKAWLDSNLPPLVEKLVRDEIERVSRGR